MNSLSYVRLALLGNCKPQYVWILATTGDGRTFAVTYGASPWPNLGYDHCLHVDRRSSPLRQGASRRHSASLDKLQEKRDSGAADLPRLTRNVVLRDITFHSAALNREMQYRVVLPRSAASTQRLPVVYVLHGGGGGFKEWTNDSDVARFAESGLILVMPEGNSSYYTNAVDPPQDRYEDYIIGDLIRDVESKFPVATGRSKRAIIGISMGGFGAVKLALHHPDLFAFVGGMSSALDVPRRAFSIKRLQQSRHYNSIFGSAGSQTRRDNDPFVLVRAANPNEAPYFFLTCGEQEGLLPANREFAAMLAARHFRFEFQTVHGGHDWNQWNAWLPTLFRSLEQHLNFKN